MKIIVLGVIILLLFAINDSFFSGMNGSKYAPSMVFLFLINDLHSWHFVNCIILTYYEVYLGYTLKLSDVLLLALRRLITLL